jgi:hypothetical protein
MLDTGRLLLDDARLMEQGLNASAPPQSAHSSHWYRGTSFNRNRTRVRPGTSPANIVPDVAWRIDPDYYNFTSCECDQVSLLCREARATR